MNREELEIELIDSLIINLRELKKEIKKKIMLSDKCMNTDTFSIGRSKSQKMSTDLNYQCLYIKQRIKSIAKQFDKSFLDVDIEECEVNPAGFHNYKI